MKTVVILLLYQNVISVLSQPTSRTSETSEDEIASPGEQFLCSACENVAGYIKRHSESIERMAKFPCTFLKDSKACDGCVKIFIAALDVGGESNVCRMIQMCSKEEGKETSHALTQIIDSFMGGFAENSKSRPTFLPLQLSSTNFKGDPENLKKVANKAFEAIGGTISNIGSLTNEGSEHLSKTFANIPIAGQLVEEATKKIGKTVEKFTSSIDEMLGKFSGLMFGSIGTLLISRSPILIRKQLAESKRTRRSTPEDKEELRDYIINIETDVPSDASQVEQLMSAFARNIKIQLIDYLDDSSSKSTDEDIFSENENPEDESIESSGVSESVSAESSAGFSEAPEEMESENGQSFHPKQSLKT